MHIFWQPHPPDEDTHMQDCFHVKHNGTEVRISAAPVNTIDVRFTSGGEMREKQVTVAQLAQALDNYLIG